MAAPRVIVFIDAQNAYHGIRRAFFDDTSDPNYVGNFQPLALGHLLASRATTSFSGAARVLKEVRIYRGLPDSRKDGKGYAVSSRQFGSWGSDPLVHVFTRPLRYPRGWPAQRPEEKGIDVRLAIDFLAMAIRREYEVGIIVSQDQDLLPALEAVCDLNLPIACEVVTWASAPNTGYRLRVPGRNLWCHYLSGNDFDAIEDRKDYGRP
jgi:hypothetical protein